MLRGLSGMIRYLRDWHVNSFDLALGQVSLQDMMPGVPSSGASQKFFPKETLLAVAVANAAALLRNIESDLTPVFLLDLDRQATWANGFKFTPLLQNISAENAVARSSRALEGPCPQVFDFTCSATTGKAKNLPVLSNLRLAQKKAKARLERFASKSFATMGFSDGRSAIMAAAVDLVDGKRESVARSADSARYILALCEFLSAIDGIESTKSTLLSEKDESGARPLDALLEARGQLQYLVLGFANFLARQMLSTDGRIAHEWNWEIGEASNGPGNLVDQALAVQALARAAQFLKVKAYATAALESYFFMNRSLWNPKSRFYNRIEGQQDLPALDEILLVLEAGEEVKSFLSEDS